MFRLTVIYMCVHSMLMLLFFSIGLYVVSSLTRPGYIHPWLPIFIGLHFVYAVGSIKVADSQGSKGAAWASAAAAVACLAFVVLWLCVMRPHIDNWLLLTYVPAMIVGVLLVKVMKKAQRE